MKSPIVQPRTPVNHSTITHHHLPTLPSSRSLVAFGPKQRAIGEAAKTQETSNFKNTIGGLKRLIGRTLNDPQVQNVEKKFLNATLVDINGTVGAEVSTFKFTSCVKSCNPVSSAPLLGQLPWRKAVFLFHPTRWCLSRQDTRHHRQGTKNRRFRYRHCRPWMVH